MGTFRAGERGLRPGCAPRAGSHLQPGSAMGWPLCVPTRSHFTLPSEEQREPLSLHKQVL